MVSLSFSFIPNIPPVPIGSNLTVNEIPHNELAITIFGGCKQYTDGFDVYLLGSEFNRWYICQETRLVKQSY